ncbi:PilZ domain-containing protein [Croceicoccus pelagius]|uniref:PilZ domain-containing protein n=1 Tax=Croceicoccus pelagius TaxID=1703341 RepID=A0A917DLU6_9SPHN|nr:PilZ domain-containing protein [Croceicoccus pelagius]GGD46955.1 hypothetical protein GCM10010989_21540 [Croceicoccus pelagius]
MQCRQEQRRNLNAPCRIRTGPGLARSATIRDLSSDGCSLEPTRIPLRRADIVEVNIGEGSPIRAEVCWMRSGEGIGLRFLRALQPQVLDQLTRKARDASIMGVAPREPIRFEQTALRPVC